MVWTAPTTRTTGELITASIWNTDVVDNLSHLFARNGDHYFGTNNYNTVSTTFGNIDGTNLNVSVDTEQANSVVEVGLNATLRGDAALTVYYDLLVDAARIGNATYGLFNHTVTTASVWSLISFVVKVEIAAAGTHTFAPQWKTTTSTARMDYAMVDFWAIETGT